MQFSHFINAAILAASLASAKCYKSGESGNWGAGLKHQDLFNTACSSLSGKFYQDETRTTCVTDSNELKWALDVRRSGKGAAEIDHNTCVAGLEREAYACEHGGKGDYDGWEYNADPNRGDCVGIDSNASRKRGLEFEA
ncbi:hypothetical protein F4778DRAFT_741948 [Xylariomycetidae sp. FL2044]|nr:hypothetical protein F4778DRAFT_741948 [Xylariomycetidae sp. FL2044]